METKLFAKPVKNMGRLSSENGQERGSSPPRYFEIPSRFDWTEKIHRKWNLVFDGRRRDGC